MNRSRVALAGPLVEVPGLILVVWGIVAGQTSLLVAGIVLIVLGVGLLVGGLVTRTVQEQASAGSPVTAVETGVGADFTRAAGERGDTDPAASHD